MSATVAAYTGNALIARMPITLPEPMANRAQSVARSVLLHWLRGVIERDEHGYAVVAGNGRTVIVLYAARGALGAAVTRGAAVTSAGAAIETLRVTEGSDFFVMTYPLSRAAATALSGLFARPTMRELCDEPGPQLKRLLTERLDQGFSGAVVVRAPGLAWATLLLDDGEVVGCYGSDDGRLKPTIEDASVLFYLDEVEVAVYPMHSQPELTGLLRSGELRSLTVGRGASIAATETAMIALLSTLEACISSSDRTDVTQPEQLTRALADSYDEAMQLTGAGRSRLLGNRAGHPLLEAHWDPVTGRIDTQRLLETLRMAAIADAWLAAAEALTVALELAVEQQLTWLSLVDEHSSAALQETLAELMSQARGLVRAMRVVEGGAPQQVSRPARGDALAVLAC